MNILNLMINLNERGIIAQLGLVIVIFAGLIAALYLVQRPAIFDPDAAPVIPDVPETSFQLELEKNPNSPFPDEPTPDSISPNTKFRVDIYVRSDLDSSNLFAAKIKFPTELLEVSEINMRSGQTFIEKEVEKFYDNSKGDISIVGGVVDPGIKTDSKSPAYLMASIIFNSKKEGLAKLTFDEATAIYRNKGNQNILSLTRGIDINIKPAPSPVPSPIISDRLSCDSTLIKDGILGKYPSGVAAYIVKSGAIVALVANYSPNDAKITWTVTSSTLNNTLTGNFASWSAPVNNTSSQQQITIKSKITLDNNSVNCPDLLVLLDLPPLPPASSPSPIPTSPPILKRDGDLNKDGKFNLADMSSLLSQFNKTGVISEADLNADGVINTFDFSLLRKILVSKGVIRELAMNPSPSPSSGPPSSTNDTSYDMGVLVIKYFPVTANDFIDLSKTGDVEESYTVVKKRTEDVTIALKQALEKSSTYLGYKNPAAKPALRYTIVDTKEYKQGVPIKARADRPTYPDYNGIMLTHSICDYVDNKNVKEVWIWAYQGPSKPGTNHPYLGIDESKMSSSFGDISNSYRYNDLPKCSKTYRVYTFNYQRYTSEAIESWGHQLEAEMDAVDRNLYRNKFQGPPHPLTTNETGRCGSVHNPPNARFEYDRENTISNKSDCLDWKPDGLGTLSNINCHIWGCSNMDLVNNNSSLNYQIWLLQNMPGRGNTKTYLGKKLRNWWDIHGDFDSIMKNSRTLYLP